MCFSMVAQSFSGQTVLEILLSKKRLKTVTESHSTVFQIPNPRPACTLGVKLSG